MEQPLHLLEVRIQDAPAPWFCNLKMLELRHALGLDYIQKNRFTEGTLIMGKLDARNK